MIKQKSIILSGANGQLGKSFKKYFEENEYSNVRYLTKTDLDICDADQIAEIVAKYQPEIWVNCAAFTNVDGAEGQEGTANHINGNALTGLCEVCKASNVLLVHYSTDYVFNGKSLKPQIETDSTDPINVYGSSKLLGEQNIQKSGCAYFIIRSSWVYSKFGHNFLQSMSNLGQKKSELQIVNDQIASPTYAKDLVETSIALIEKHFEKDAKIALGIYHFTNSGECSWKDFAEEIFRLKKYSCIVNGISTKEYGAKANRPLYSKLDCSKVEQTLETKIRDWKTALEACINEK